MPPAVIDAMASFRTAIDAQEMTQSLRMARAWLEVSRGLDVEFERLARDVGNAAAAGRGATFWHVSRMDRYQSLLAQILQQQRKFEPIAANDIATTQALLGRWSIAHNSTLITVQRPAIAGQFDRLPVEAITNMVGNAGDGTPLGNVLRRSWGDEGFRVGNALVRGTALGWHPTKTARAMRDEVNVTLEKSIQIARTEQMRVYRETGRQQYIASKLVEGYIRIAAKSIRTCMACLLADGQFYELSVPFEEHVNGRCVPLAKVIGAPPIVFETGEQWFMRQNAATQRRMMGPGRYAAWQQGRFALPDLITVRQNDTWGNSLQVTPLRVLAARPVESATPARVPAPVPQPATPTPALTYQSSPQQKLLVDRYVMSEIQQYAQRHGLSTDYVRDTVMTTMTELVDNIPVSINFRSINLGGLQNSGRFLSQFETGKSGGMFDPSARANAELKGLGYPLNVAPRERPIYGYYSLMPQPPTAASGYGRLQFVLKPEVRQRSTFTMGDSLARFTYDNLYGASVFSPKLGAADTHVAAIMQYVSHRDKDLLTRTVAYIEAQVQGGVQLSDVGYVVDHNLQLTPAERSWLQGLGIGVR